MELKFYSRVSHLLRFIQTLYFPLAAKRAFILLFFVLIQMKEIILVLGTREN